MPQCGMSRYVGLKSSHAELTRSEIGSTVRYKGYLYRIQINDLVPLNSYKAPGILIPAVCDRFSDWL